MLTRELIYRSPSVADGRASRNGIGYGSWSAASGGSPPRLSGAALPRYAMLRMGGQHVLAEHFVALMRIGSPGRMLGWLLLEGTGAELPVTN